MFYICTNKITNTMNTNQIEWIIDRSYFTQEPTQPEEAAHKLTEYQHNPRKANMKDLAVILLRRLKHLLQGVEYQFHRLTFGVFHKLKLSQRQAGVVVAVGLGVIVKFGVLDTTKGHSGIWPFASHSSHGSSSMFGLAPAAPSMLNEEDVKRYVAEYQSISVAEMHKFGIPASVSMAQGLIESRCGESVLSSKNKNHFGIKCFSKNCAKGHCSNFTDDSHKDFFRKFESPTQSWRAHSELLSQGRYKPLHDESKDDYEAWAKGLQRLGYATDQDYAEKLITIIEQYDLASLDNE